MYTLGVHSSSTDEGSSYDEGAHPLSSTVSVDRSARVSFLRGGSDHTLLAQSGIRTPHLSFSLCA